MSQDDLESPTPTGGESPNTGQPVTDGPAADASAEEPASIRADAPLENEAEDRLGRAPFAAGVVRSIESRGDLSSVVIAIYGPWGDGKTTVLNFVRHRLEASGGRFVVVPFNPWLIRDELNLLPVFFSTLATALGRAMGGRRDQIGGLIRKYGGVLSGLSLGMGGIGLDPGKAAERLGEALSDRTLEDMRAEFETILREEKKEVVVVIDDIDRLDDSEIYAVFKLVKLAAAFDGITYLLAFDDEKVAAALGKRYTGASERQGGLEFLEKIVQLPLQLPRARRAALDGITLEALQGALNAAHVDVDEADARDFRVRYSEGLAPAIKSVRTAKRYANAAGFALPLLVNETYPIDVLTIEGISVCYPALYRAIRDHPDWFLLTHEFVLSHQEKALRDEQRDRIEGVLNGLEPHLRGPARGLIRRLFPQTDRLWSNVGSVNERDEWAEKQRVCSAEYFERYFSYGLTPEEIGDRELSEALAETALIPQRVAGLVTSKGDAVIEPLLTKLGRLVDRLDVPANAAVRDALVSLGPRVSQGSVPMFLQLNKEESTARLLADLVIHLESDEERYAAAAEIIGTAEPLSFAAECLHWFRARRSASDDRRPLTDDDWNRLLARFAERIIGHAATLASPLWEEPRGLWLMNLAAEGGQRDSIRQHSQQWLERESGRVISLLRAAAGVAYSGSTGLPHPQDLTTDKYEGLGSVAPMDAVRTAVAARRGGAAPPEVFPQLHYEQDAETKADAYVLDQFAFQDARSASPPGTPEDAAPP